MIKILKEFKSTNISPMILQQTTGEISAECPVKLSFILAVCRKRREMKQNLRIGKTEKPCWIQEWKRKGEDDYKPEKKKIFLRK